MGTHSSIPAWRIPWTEETLEPPCEEIILFCYTALDVYELSYDPYLQITM